MSERKREYEEEASSTSISPVKKTKLDDSDSSSGSHDVVVIAASSSSYSFTSSEDSATDECSDDQRSSISSGCFNSDSKEIAKNRPTFVTDLEVHQVSERETKTATLITTTNFRKETSPVSEGLGETTTEMESSSSPTKRIVDNRRKPQEVRKTPTPREIEDFFSELEKEYDDKQRRFIEKYNFDIVNDKPLEGRYKWDQKEEEEEKE